MTAKSLLVVGDDDHEQTFVVHVRKRFDMRKVIIDDDTDSSRHQVLRPVNGCSKLFARPYLAQLLCNNNLDKLIDCEKCERQSELEIWKFYL